MKCGSNLGSLHVSFRTCFSGSQTEVWTVCGVSGVSQYSPHDLSQSGGQVICSQGVGSLMWWLPLSVGLTPSSPPDYESWSRATQDLPRIPPHAFLRLLRPAGGGGAERGGGVGLVPHSSVKFLCAEFHRLWPRSQPHALLQMGGERARGRERERKGLGEGKKKKKSIENETSWLANFLACPPFPWICLSISHFS